jgi:hypothetical protein
VLFVSSRIIEEIYDKESGGEESMCNICVRMPCKANIFSEVREWRFASGKFGSYEIQSRDRRERERERERECKRFL